ncbi:MAG TPA: arginine--tRNA ligase [Terriglobia bacterium]|nr:arginine--tRNA ligase [Terriglobia bacterium]
MFLSFQAQVRQAAREFVARQYGVEANVIVSVPPRPEMGDMALPLAMELARRLRRPPRQVAEEIAAALKALPGVARAEVAGAGYVNLFLDRAAFAAGVGAEEGRSEESRARLKGEGEPAVPSPEKIIVEHTNINPNKAAHIGHLRNAALGDTFVRLLRSRGATVEVQNYIDNTGVQVADVVVGFLELEKKSPQEVERLIADPAVKFDYYCWDLYARVSQYFEQDKTRTKLRQDTLQAIERGSGDAARLAEIVSTAIVHRHLATMLRMNVVYDLLPRESEILHLRFWDQAFELLKSKGAIVFETEGRNKGCWVMRPQGREENPEPTEPETEGYDESKVIVRSNGTVTYVGKDIAYQLWKFGLLGRDFHYRPFHTYPDGRIVWASAAEQAPGIRPPAFGHGAKVYNVIDTRQSYLQNIVVEGLRALGYTEQAERSIHFSYEMVALSPRTCELLGIELSEEDRKRPYVEVSGRKGLGVKADDLIDRLIAEAQREVEARHPDDPPERRQRIARQIAIGALRYFLLKYTCNAVIAFDLKEALSFEGETGPYVQYAVVRARNIFAKYEESRSQQTGDRSQKGEVEAGRATLEKFLASPQGDLFWQLLYQASQWEAAVEQAIATTEPAAVAKFAFQLAQSFNNFYHRHHILTEPDPQRQAFLLWLVRVVEHTLVGTLDLLGIEVPEAM